MFIKMFQKCCRIGEKKIFITESFIAEVAFGLGLLSEQDFTRQRSGGGGYQRYHSRRIRSKGWKYGGTHRMATSRSEMKDVGLLVVLNWEYLLD